MLKIPSVGTKGGAATTNLVIGIVSAGIVGYLAYTHFFQTSVVPTAQAAAATAFAGAAGLDLVTLEEQLINGVMMYAQNRDTALANKDRIRTAAQTYRIKLEEMIKEQLGGRLTQTQQEQQMTELIKDIAASLDLPLRSGMTPPNPMAWEYWKNNLECKGGERWSRCLDRCVPSYQPEPFACAPRPGPGGFPLPAYPSPGICGAGQRWSNCFRRCVPAGQPEPIVPCPPGPLPFPGPFPYPRPRPTPTPIPWWPFPRPGPRPGWPPRGRAVGWWKKYFPTRWPPRPGFPGPRPGCRRDWIACRRRYGGNCNRECRRWGGNCAGCRCACHGSGFGVPPRPNFSPASFMSSAARAYSVQDVIGRIQRKTGRKICKARCRVIRGRGRDDCEKACRRQYRWRKRTHPPIAIPPPPIPAPLPIPVPPSVPLPTPQCPPGFSGVWPQCVPPACPVGYAGQWPNCFPIPQPPIIVPQAPSPYVSPVPNTYPDYLTLEQVVRQSTTPIGVYAGRARAYAGRTVYPGQATFQFRGQGQHRGWTNFPAQMPERFSGLL
jgi:hypothetical protein